MEKPKTKTVRCGVKALAKRFKVSVSHMSRVLSGERKSKSLERRLRRAGIEVEVV